MLEEADFWKKYSNEELQLQYHPDLSVTNYDEYIQAYTRLSSEAKNKLMNYSNVRYGEDAQETIDIYFPHTFNKNKPLPALIYYHGGYWYLLSKNESSFMAEGLAEANIITVVVNYTLAPKANIGLIVDQSRRAFKYVFENAKEFGIDGSKLYIAGSSAGGHLVGTLLNSQWLKDYNLPLDAIAGAVPLSGLMDLKPMQQTFVN